jgi:hypothetical protein
MTIYYDEDRDAVVENLASEYAEFEDGPNGDRTRLVMHMADLPREEKRKSLAKAAVDAVEASDEYRVVEEPEFEWVPEDERNG